MIDRTLVDFVKVLRTAEIQVSPAETLDAISAMNIVGYKDREFLKDSLSIVLSKIHRRRKPSLPALTGFLLSINSSRQTKEPVPAKNRTTRKAILTSTPETGSKAPARVVVRVRVREVDRKGKPTRKKTRQNCNQLPISVSCCYPATGPN